MMIILALLLTLSSPCFAADAPKHSFTDALAAFQKDGSNANREAVIIAARSAKTPPAVPKEAQRRLARGEAAFESAKSPEDFSKAVAEFTAATNAAPWFAAPYYNLGIAREKSGDPSAAMRDFRLYLLAAPDANDAADVEKRIYKLEYAAEEGSKKKAAEAQESRFTGTWNRSSRGGDGSTNTTILSIARAADGAITFKSKSAGSSSDGYKWPVHIRLDGGELSFKLDELLDDVTVCGSYSVRGTVSTDGNTLTLRYTLLPLPPGRPLRCPLPEFYWDHTDIWNR